MEIPHASSGDQPSSPKHQIIDTFEKWLDETVLPAHQRRNPPDADIEQDLSQLSTPLDSQQETRKFHESERNISDEDNASLPESEPDEYQSYDSSESKSEATVELNPCNESPNTTTEPSLSLELESAAPTSRIDNLGQIMNSSERDGEPDYSYANDVEASTNNELGSTNTMCDDSAEPTPGSDQGTEADRWIKQRNSSSNGVVGAEQVNEQAPQINRRFYRGLDRPSVVARNTRRRQEQRARRRRQEAADGDGGVDATDETGRENSGIRSTANDQQQERGSRMGGTVQSVFQSMATLFAHVSAEEVLVSATLVVEDEGEVVVAERVRFFERKWKLVLFLMCFVVVLASVVPAVLMATGTGGFAFSSPMQTTSYPSMQPSSRPSFDPSPTLEIVQARGHILCGLPDIETSWYGHSLKLCHSIAAVLFGDPEDYVAIHTEEFGPNFKQLNDRNVDILLRGVTHTVEREVRETSTGVGFSFSSPYYYDGMGYFGLGKYVKCAEEKMRYDECSSLRICVHNPSTSFNYLQSSFPSDFVLSFPSNDHEELFKTMWNGTCVWAYDQSFMLRYETVDKNAKRHYKVGKRLMTKEPHAVVTRNDDREFSDIMNWVIHALYYGEEQGLTIDPSLCQKHEKMASIISDLNFLNAVHCVGNYNEVVQDQNHLRLDIDKINNGTTGMLYATPFGELGNVNDVIGSVGLLDDIRNERGSLKCGYVSTNGITGGIAQNDPLTGMSISYCHTMAAALFNGDHKAVELFNFSEYDSTSSFDALNNGSIDVLAGRRVEQKYDFGGFQFSSPYYYGNETAIDDVSFFSLATREDNVTFSSFVNCVVLATIFAQENGITRRRSQEMPLLSLYGSEFKWALRDAISYSGSYDEIYVKHFGNVAGQERGRNNLNEGGPQIHSFPGMA